jgi:hypothetical protein
MCFRQIDSILADLKHVTLVKLTANDHSGPTMEGYLVKVGKGMMGGGKKRWCKILKGDPSSMTNRAQFLVYKDVGAPAPKNTFLLANSKISEEENPRDKKYIGRTFYVESQGSYSFFSSSLLNFCRKTSYFGGRKSQRA